LWQGREWFLLHVGVEVIVPIHLSIPSTWNERPRTKRQTSQNKCQYSARIGTFFFPFAYFTPSISPLSWKPILLFLQHITCIMSFYEHSSIELITIQKIYWNLYCVKIALHMKCKLEEIHRTMRQLSCIFSERN